MENVEEGRVVEMNTHPLVMVVDDEKTIRRLLCRLLELEGYRVISAADGDSALALLEAQKPDLVILDIKMPGKSGTEVLTEIKARFPDTAVIMATAVADTQTAIDCMRQGSDDYIIKPFKLREVVLTVEQALERRVLKLEIRESQRHLGQKVEKQAEEIYNLQINAITALAHALEAKDKYTSGHSQRVAAISTAIAEELNMPQDIIEKIKLAGSVHDIGKIGVSETILNKPGRLTELEYWHMTCHSEGGVHILAPVVQDREVLKMIRHHHEHWDGTGYPHRLRGEQIPPGARILQVADAYDAMTSERPYRGAMSAEAACAEIERCKGTQFDPDVVDAFLKICKVKQFNWAGGSLSAVYTG